MNQLSKCGPRTNPALIVQLTLLVATNPRRKPLWGDAFTLHQVTGERR
jgi:hypothetical protein